MILKTEDLVKEFSGIVATDHLNFEAEEGQIECVIGPNGAGKTTFFNLITGVLNPDSGSIFFKGEEITEKSVDEIARRGIVRKYQTPSVYEEFTIGRNMRIAANAKSGNNTSVTEILKLIGLEGRESEQAGALDHGRKQWLEIGMVLANDPELILLDEPTAGMTTQETNNTVDLIKTINSEGITVIAIEHDLDFVRQLESRVTVLDRGSVLAQGQIAEIEANEEVQEVYIGGDY